MADDTALNDPPLGIAGLTPLSERIYLFVLRLGRAGSATVAEHFGIGDEEALGHLHQLRAMGLVALRDGERADFTPVDPRYSLRAIATKLTDSALHIRDQIAELAERYDQGTTTNRESDQTQVLSDPDVVAGWYARLQSQSVHEFMAFDRPPYVAASMDPLEAAVLDRGVRWRAVYAGDSFREADIWDEVERWAAQGEEGRIVAELPVKLAISDRTIALVSLTLDENNHEILITESKPLIDALCDLFEFYWERALPVPTSRKLEDAEERFVSTTELWRSTAGRGPTKDEQAILALIGAGLKDDVIARQLGMSPRTLRRRSQDLMVELGAANRFQAGVEAARRGWV